MLVRFDWVPYAAARGGDGSVTAHRLSMWMVAVCCAAVCGPILAGTAGADTLPDGRFYEQVTPEEKHGSDVYLPRVFEDTHDEFEVEQSRAAKSTIETGFTFQSASDGGGIAYVAAPTVGGNESMGGNAGNEYLATRSSSGAWSQRALSPENAPAAYFQAFSSDLATAVVDSPTPLSSLAPGFEEAAGNFGNYDVLYSLNTNGSKFDPLISTKPPHRAMGLFGTAGPHNEPPGPVVNGYRIGKKFLALEGASGDESHLLFAANDALTEASEGRPAAEGGEESEFENEDNLYEWVGGRLRLVNVLPNGTTRANANFGRIEGSAPFSHIVLSRVISTDGSRIFWTDSSSGHIYMREDGTRTVEISPEGTYQTATADGSTVFYTNGDLYAYDVASGHTTDLTPGVAVEQVVGSSENGQYVYYLANGGKLALWHNGASTSITSVPLRLLPEGRLSVEVTPDGHSIVFTIEESKFYPGLSESNYVERVDVYDADTETLYCASCTSHGTLGRLPMTNSENVYQPRWMSSNGAHAFFVTREGLVPQDTNETQDVYEWERPGVGGCSESTGCVYLLSAGTSVAHSAFLDASESGNDVFIVTRSNLAGNDEDGLNDIYDVRVGQPKSAPPACTGTGCQGLPSAPPIFATPSSVTFEGVGNFSSSVQSEKANTKTSKKAKARKKKKRKKKRKGKGSRMSKNMRAARAGVKGGRS